MLLGLVMVTLQVWSQDNTTPSTFKNPILPGFNPDPSICRRGEDYYLVTSSFTWFPGLPIYHSKDLVHWKLIGHGIDAHSKLAMHGTADKNGIWAPTIRFHDGIFYIITTCNTCGGNFYITATDPAGPWSDPIWLPTAVGIDPSLFWDDDGKCYYVGNRWDKKTANAWPGQTSIWLQEFDIKNNRLVGEQKQLTFGHANNARYTEAPHIYKIKGRYLLMIGEGGTDQNHAVTVHHSESIFGPYVADQINPVITHRHLGTQAYIQAVGHADLVQTQDGDWWAVLLAKRSVDGEVPLGRETFLCKVDFEGNTPIFNSGSGKVLEEQLLPSLRRSADDSAEGSDKQDVDHWYTIRKPQSNFFQIKNGKVSISLTANSLDSLSHAPVLLRKVTDHRFVASVALDADKRLPQGAVAGMVLYRTTNSYYLLVKEDAHIVLYKRFKDKKDIIAKVAWNAKDTNFKIVVDNLKVRFFYGDAEHPLHEIGGDQTIIDLADNAVNRFNGLGVGLYASHSGTSLDERALFVNFLYERKDSGLSR